MLTQVWRVRKPFFVVGLFLLLLSPLSCAPVDLMGVELKAVDALANGQPGQAAPAT
jgi:hypothetical protein